MHYNLTQKYIEINFPNENKEAINYFKINPEKWLVEWREKVQTMSFSSMIMPIFVSKPKRLTVEARIKAWKESIIDLRLVACCKKKRKEFIIETIPDVLVEREKSNIEATILEENRIEKLSPEELQKETNDLLNQLMKSQGPGDALGMIYTSKNDEN